VHDDPAPDSQPLTPVEADYSSICLTLCPNRETKQQRMSWFGSSATLMPRYALARLAFDLAATRLEPTIAQRSSSACGVPKLGPACESPVFRARTEFTHPTPGRSLPARLTVPRTIRA
jgi:hypothetical protein